MLGALLLVLHSVVWWDFGEAFSRSLLLAHVGLFLLWQPFWDRHRKLRAGGAAVVVLIAGLFALQINWLLVTFWSLLLLALVAGRASSLRGRARFVYLGALVFLVSEILVGCVPPMANLAPIMEEMRDPVRYGFLLLLAGLFFLSEHKPRQADPGSVDFVFGLTMSMLTILLALGALTFHFVTHTGYLASLILTLLSIGLFLLAISWLWLPMSGFSGLGQIWERHIQNVGSPLERWLNDLQRLAAEDRTPLAFIESVLEELARLRWVSGVSWQGEGIEGNLGVPTRHICNGHSGGIRVTVYARRRMGPALYLHASLLLRLIAYFHRAKLREEELTRQAQLRAIFETGARLTHDVKNLLQSLQAVTSAVEHARPEDTEALTALLKRQLPTLGQRLKLALDKLQSPVASETGVEPVSRWWHRFEARCSAEVIELSHRIETDIDVPTELLDTVVDNLLDNATFKLASEPGIRLTVTLESTPGHFEIVVSDTGSPIPRDRARRLFDSVVASEAGLGVGLLQAGRFAEQLGYRLQLSENGEQGRVSFSLTRREHSVEDQAR